MNNREIVQQGLNARKDVRAAEARAERYRETMETIRDDLFREQMHHQRARSEWLGEKEIMTGWINRQHDLIHSLREELKTVQEREHESRQLRYLINAAKSAVTLVALISIRDLGWMEPWLAETMAGVSLFCLGFTGFKWLRNQ